MIVHEPRLGRANGELRLSARVEFEQRPFAAPDELWFSFPEDQAALVSARADSFAVTLLLLAMALRENLEVRGALSPRLLYGLDAYQRFFQWKFPHRFGRVRLDARRLCAARAPAEHHRVVCAFSGGVDSFYTLWRHLPPRQPVVAFRLTHVLFVHGYDIPLRHAPAFDVWRERFAALMHRLGLGLLTARTNARDFVSGLGWNLVHAPVLIGAAHALGTGVRAFLAPSGATFTDTEWDSSDPRSDHWLSTESLRVFHDGAGASRSQKAAVLASWPETYGALRVCWEQTNLPNNCCRCEKCTRTMIALETEGALSRYSTFPLPLNRHGYWALRASFPTFRRYWSNYVRGARARGRRDVVWLLYREALIGLALTGPLWGARKCRALWRRLCRKGRPGGET